MAWYRNIVDSLRACNSADVIHRGDSMSGRIENGQIATIEPVRDRAVSVGDLVFVFCQGGYLVREIGEIANLQFRIVDRTGHTVGWTEWHNILGIVSRVTDPPEDNAGR